MAKNEKMKKKRRRNNKRHGKIAAMGMCRCKGSEKKSYEQPFFFFFLFDVMSLIQTILHSVLFKFLHQNKLIVKFCGV